MTVRLCCRERQSCVALTYGPVLNKKLLSTAARCPVSLPAAYTSGGMDMEASKYKFEDMGIAKLLKDGYLSVPPNQRAYAWEDRNVRDLLQDLNDAISRDGDEYFLGSVVLIQSDGLKSTIADGQQRLATTTILLCRLRDHLYRLGRQGSATSIDGDFIRSIDRETEQMIPHLKLNLEDNEFFSTRILPLPHEIGNGLNDATIRASNKRLASASRVIDEFVSSLIGNLPEASRADHLLKWVNFVERRANIIVVRVSDILGAFRIFETLNDRGLRASQADLLKNYFLSKSGHDRLSEAQMMWSSIGAALETLGDDDSDLFVTYLRHLWITKHGPTKERELADKIKGDVASSATAMSFLNEASSSTLDYVALWSSRNPKWTAYRPTTRYHIETIAHHLQVDQIRPLLFAVARKFNPDEADKAFCLFVSWSVRFLIFGGRGGMLDTQYSLRAKEVGTGQITRARELREAMESYVPSDRDFEEAFAVARVSRATLARYYLRALEKTEKDEAHPEFVSNDETADVNLEHILPLNGGDIDEDIAKSARKALGNMVLLRSDVNTLIGNQSFEQKKSMYAMSSYTLTKNVAEYKQWTPEAIRDRQRKLAKIAVKTWPLTFK